MKNLWKIYGISFFVTSTLEPFLKKASPECGSIRECSNEGIDVPHGGDRSSRGAGKSFHHFLPANHRSIKPDALKIFCDTVLFDPNSVGDPDPYVFGPPGSASGSVSHKYGYGSGSFHIKQKKKEKLEFLLFCNFFLTFYQCSASGSGFVRFWSSQIRITIRIR